MASITDIRTVAQEDIATPIAGLAYTAEHVDTFSATGDADPGQIVIGASIGNKATQDAASSLSSAGDGWNSAGQPPRFEHPNFPVYSGTGNGTLFDWNGNSPGTPGPPIDVGSGPLIWSMWQQQLYRTGIAVSDDIDARYRNPGRTGVDPYSGDITIHERTHIVAAATFDPPILLDEDGSATFPDDLPTESWDQWFADGSDDSPIVTPDEGDFDDVDIWAIVMTVWNGEADYTRTDDTDLILAGTSDACGAQFSISAKWFPVGTTPAPDFGGTLSEATDWGIILDLYATSADVVVPPGTANARIHYRGPNAVS